MKESRFELFDGLISSAGKTIQRIKTNKMQKYGLGSTHTTCLCKLGKVGAQGLTQKELTEQEGIDRAQISRVLRDLENRGLVQNAGESAYKKKYYLTEAGAEIVGEMNEIILEINSYVSDEFSDEEMAAFYSVLHRINENLKKAEEKYCRQAKEEGTK
ncbi:MarR family winged helix-turn-helix transcriptional regulator [Anaerotignum sp.]|nr:helix-turn-helix domain-containing protein [Anaerotignum sp.]MBQ7758677.1 MarR family transcriptional regulator [Anaerotignum sp.]